MKTKNTGFAVFFFVFCLVITGCATMESDWKETKSVNTVRAYSNFISRYPKSDYASQAHKEIMELDWKLTLQVNSASYYRYFISKHKTSPYVREAQTKMAYIEELTAYEKAIKSDSIELLQKFMSDYPTNSRRDEVTSRLSRLEEKAEEDLYRVASQSGSFNTLQLYMNKYPSGRYYDQIKRKLDSFSWVVLSSPQILNWEQVGKGKPLSSSQLSDHIRKSSTNFLIRGCTRGSEILMFHSHKLLFSQKGAVIEGWGMVPPSYPAVSQVRGDEWLIKLETFIEGDCLPKINFDTIIAVDSILTILPIRADTDQFSAVNFYGHFIRRGTIRVVSGGLELQPGTEILMSNSK